MIEEAKRGGITQVITKFSEANNKYMQNYDQNKGQCTTGHTATTVQ